MSGFVEGIDRSQSTLFPRCWMTMWARTIRFGRSMPSSMGWICSSLASTALPPRNGAAGYHPATLLKIYIYGYFNRVQSSRRLERECQRNVELVWLTGHLMPDFKTIADFRKDYGEPIGKVCRAFVLLCRRLDLRGGERRHRRQQVQGGDNRGKNFTEAKMKRRLEQIDESIARYLSQLDTADRQGDGAGGQDHAAQGEDREAARGDRAPQHAERQDDREPGQANLADGPRCALDGDQRQGSGIVGYNVQSAVDTTHHLIVAHEVTNVGTDRSQLSNIAEQARTEMGAETLDVVADRGITPARTSWPARPPASPSRYRSR